MESAQNIINQIRDIQVVVNSAIKIIDNKEYDNLASYLEFSNKLIDNVWLGSAKIQVTLQELDKALKRLEARVDEKMSIQLSSQKL
jgi:protein associated with RNAse G/E|tara:strand:- start:160 stop:417 length:258 start_codon:yes stop_codon:yes gene_type:complete